MSGVRGAPALTRQDLAQPIDAAEFAALMTGFEPYEPSPEIAVAVSGGGDSMALLLLAAEWACARGGQVFALTVDHGLRAASADEAREVGTWCAARGISHQILRWDGPHPASGIQAAARQARYALLEAWCRDHHVLHLLIAHHQEDQAETVMMRRMRRSGGDGLAGMAAVIERRSMRLLRPLLSLPRARLRATLQAVGQGWIEDPSNRNPAYLRTALRATLAATADAGIAAARGASLAGQFAAVRAEREIACAQWLARTVALHPAGFAWLDPVALAEAPPALGVKALGAVITTVSGGDYAPPRAGLERLFSELSEAGPGFGRTLGGCLIVHRRGKLLVCREPQAAAPATAIDGLATRWDGRFELVLAEPAGAPLWLGPLGSGALPALPEGGEAALAAIPPAARPTLPAVHNAKGVVAVPLLRYFEPRLEKAMAPGVRLYFRPTRPLAAAGFRIV